MSRKRVIVVTVGIMLSLFMAAVESTVVATAMPTIVSELGGLAFYSWVFTAYMLTSTTTVPIYGKLSDILGRKPVFMVAMALFLVGSVLCGQAQNMGQLIAFRALQGLGAGGLMPLAFIMIGDIFSFEQRARMQGLFSGVWGVAAIIGPLLGGFLVDNVSWQWVFYVNLVPGVLATALLWFGWRDPARAPRAARLPIDFAGTVLLSAGVVALLLGLTDLAETAGRRADRPGGRAVHRPAVGRAPRGRPDAAAAALQGPALCRRRQPGAARGLGDVRQHVVHPAFRAGRVGNQRDGRRQRAHPDDARLGRRQHHRQPLAAALRLPHDRPGRHGLRWWWAPSS